MTKDEIKRGVEFSACCAFPSQQAVLRVSRPYISFCIICPLLFAGTSKPHLCFKFLQARFLCACLWMLVCLCVWGGAFAIVLFSQSVVAFVTRGRNSYPACNENGCSFLSLSLSFEITSFWFPCRKSSARSVCTSGHRFKFSAQNKNDRTVCKDIEISHELTLRLTIYTNGPSQLTFVDNCNVDWNHFVYILSIYRSFLRVFSWLAFVWPTYLEIFTFSMLELSPTSLMRFSSFFRVMFHFFRPQPLCMVFHDVIAWKNKQTITQTTIKALLYPSHASLHLGRLLFHELYVALFVIYSDFSDHDLWGACNHCHTSMSDGSLPSIG